MPRHGDHARVIGAITEGRNKHFPAHFCAHFCQASAQAGVRGHAASNGDLSAIHFLHGFLRFAKEHVDEGFLNRGADVCFIFFDEVWVVFDFFLEEVEDGGFNAGKAEVQSGHFTE